MIDDFRNLAANERTYLAWVRTAIAIMAFGYLIEKFDLFVRYSHYRHDATHLHHKSEFIGIALMLSGLIVIVVSTARFVTNQFLLKSEKTHTQLFHKIALVSDILLSILIFSLGIASFSYLAHMTA